MRPIPYGKIPQVLLVGNGINLSYGYDSWDKIVKNTEPVRTRRIREDSIKNMTLPMQIVVASEDNVDICMHELAKKYQEQEIKPEHKVFIKEMLTCPVDAILTTNYSFEIEKTILEDFSAYNLRKLDRCLTEENSRQKQLRMFRCYELPLENNPSLWHIHGNAFYKHSVIMGHYYYGKLLAEINEYIPKLLARYNGCNKYEKDYVPRSWVDYFMLGDVHIVGMGMDLSEMDLWWLSCCKKRNFPDRLTRFYDPEFKDNQKSLLMNCYGIEEAREIKWNGDYPNYYRAIFESLKGKTCRDIYK